MPMEEFKEALCSRERNKGIPEKLDYFSSLIGKWDIEWIDHLEDNKQRHVKGEWIFSRVLDGTAIQDLFIVPSRTERIKHLQADAEYGTTLRVYNPKNETWDIFYACTGTAIQLTGRKVNNEIILTENNEKQMRYVFYDLTPSTFKWRKELLNDTGNWQISAKVLAKKAKQQRTLYKNHLK